MEYYEAAGLLCDAYSSRGMNGVNDLVNESEFPRDAVKKIGEIVAIPENRFLDKEQLLEKMYSV